MIIRPNPKTFGLEGRQEIIENNLLVIQDLHKNNLISDNVFQKMIKIALNESKRCD